MTAGGLGAAGIDVLLLRPAEVDDSLLSPVLKSNSFSSDESRHRRELQAASTDAGGRFEFQIAAAGNYVLFAEQGGGVRVSSAPFVLALGEKKRIDLVLPAEAPVAPGRWLCLLMAGSWSTRLRSVATGCICGTWRRERPRPCLERQAATDRFFHRMENGWASLPTTS